jgi:hypothetical protein
LFISFFREVVVETDVTGRCDTEYIPAGNTWGKLTYRYFTYRGL